jgi:hypothetical protein
MNDGTKIQETKPANQKIKIAGAPVDYEGWFHRSWDKNSGNRTSGLDQSSS